MPEPAVPARNVALPMPVAAYHGGAEARKDGRAVLGIPGLRHGGKLRGNETVGRTGRIRDRAKTRASGWNRNREVIGQLFYLETMRVFLCIYTHGVLRTGLFRKNKSFK